MNSLNIGERITQLRKQKGWSQSDLAKAIEASRDMIGKYERNEVIPSVEIARNIADYLDVSLDYLVGQTDKQLDQKTMKRILEVQNLKQNVQDKIFDYIDLIIRDTKTKQAYSS